jgi:hypothetical protein
MGDEYWNPREPSEFSSWDELLAKLLSRHTGTLLYRGQSDYDWQIRTTLLRGLMRQAEAGGPIDFLLYESAVQDEDRDNHVLETEAQLLRAFMDEAERLRLPDLPSHDDRLGWWELMQHHGAPTRLVDWTRSPLIALWFAIQDLKHDDHDAALWIFDSRTSWLNYAEQIRIVDKEHTGWTDFQSSRALQNTLAENAISAPRLGGPVVPLMVIPRVTNPRAVAQQSMMTLVPHIGGTTEGLLNRLAARIRVRADWVPDILRTCENFGLSRLSLFRDLDSLGQALATDLHNNVPLSPVSLALRDWWTHNQAAKP